MSSQTHKPPADGPPPSTPTPVAEPPGTDAARTAANAVDREATGESELGGHGHGLFVGSTGWLISLSIHFVMILLLALWSLPSLPPFELPKLLASTSTEDLDTFDDVPVISFDETDVEAELDPSDFTSDADLVADAFSEAFDLETPSFVEFSEIGITSAVSGDATELTGAGTGATYGRGAEARGVAVRRRGGSDASETAVREALAWIARHQNPDGSWSLNHAVGPCNGRCENAREGDPTDSVRAATGLALLPFLGAGQTHKVGKHRQVVNRGLAALIAMGQPNKKGLGVAWSDRAGRMYSHGIAAIVLAEALGMTGDYELAGPAQAAIDYITYAQGPDGGWRYTPRSRVGDTSVVGWQIMALKSGHLANLNISPQVARGAFSFLDLLQRDEGATYAYVSEQTDAEGVLKPGAARPTTSAVGLLSRMYLGWEKDNPALVDGVNRLAKRGPTKNNVYHNYYAAQVLFQYTSGEGKMWRDWNTKLRDQLIEQQDTEGHARGSWFVGGPHANSGGRLYHTSLATMTLEVYYRYLPIYKLNTKSVEFPE